MQIFKNSLYLLFSLWYHKIFHYKIRWFYHLNSIFKLHFRSKSKFCAWHLNLGNCHNILSLKGISHHEAITNDWGIPYEFLWWNIIINIVFLVKSKLRLHGKRFKWSCLIINWKSLEFKWPWTINCFYIWNFCLPVHKIK